MLFRGLYEIVLVIFGLLMLPKYLYQVVVKHKYRNSFLNRFGSRFPIIQKGERTLVWIHAVSLGETKAITPLVKSLRRELGNPIIVFSTTTETGHVEACRTVDADHHVYLPLDFGWVIRPIIRRTAPNLVVLCESDFWYNFLSASKECGAKIALVNGKVSSRSFKRFLKFPFVAESLFSPIDLFCVQSQLYGKRFESLGVPEEKIKVTGNIKLDGDYPKLSDQELQAWRMELGILPSDPVVVIGSTHNPEESLLMVEMEKVWAEFPNLKVIFVPRHPERFNEVAALLQKGKMGVRRLSQKGDQQGESVILVDAMGQLRKCYQLADVAIVAGSYTEKVGGHNILEPCWYGVPVIFGPHMYGQPDFVDLITEYQAGMQVSLENVAETVIDLLKDDSKHKVLSDGGFRLSSSVQGATKRTLDLLKTLTFS